MLNVPKNWNEITLYQFQELTEAGKGELDVFDELSILLNTTPDDPIIEELDIDEAFEIIDNLKWLKTPPSGQIKRQIGEFHLKKFNNLNLGEFIDIEHYFEDKIANLHFIAAILYKRQMVDKWDNIEWEPYKYELEDRAEMYLDEPVTTLINLISEYNTFREEFLRSYENLFQDNSNNEDESELTGREKIDAEKEAMEEKAKSKWSWESILLGLSNGDVTKFDDLFNTSLILVFNTLSAKKTLGV